MCRGKGVRERWEDAKVGEDGAKEGNSGGEKDVFTEAQVKGV